MAQTILKKQGAFDADLENAINAMFTELYGQPPTGSLTDAHIFVGNSSNLATDVAMSVDATIDNTGAVSIETGVRNRFLVADGASGSGMLIGSGVTALSGTNPTTVTTPGGGNIDFGAVVATLISTDVSTGTAYVTVDFSNGNNQFNLYAWKKDGTASTGTENVSWMVYGTPD